MSMMARGKKWSFIFLLLLCLLNIPALTGICLLLSCLQPLPACLPQVFLLCGISLLSTSILAALTSSHVLHDFVEPSDLAVAKALSLSGSKTDEEARKKCSLGQAVELLINELENSRQRERLIAEYSSDMLACLDSEYRILSLNKQAESIWGFSLISLVSKKIDSLIVHADRQPFLDYLQSCRTADKAATFECRLCASSGNLIDLEWQVDWSESLQCYFCLARDITDRKEKQRLKTEVMAMVGHDLRAPLVNVSYILEQLSNGDSAAGADEAVLRARSGVSHMLSLVDRLLDAEQLESGSLKVEPVIIPVSEIYEKCKELLQDLCSRKNQVLEWPETERLALADFDRSCQILCNLVSNALKWSPEGEPIRILESSDCRFITIRVSDRGPGIPEERRQTIFERFKSSELKNDILKSSGLGLYIARKLALLQGGQIGLETGSEKGSTFWFSLKEISPEAAELLLQDGKPTDPAPEKPAGG